MDNIELKFGVVGSILTHSKSPDIQNAGLAYLGINAKYEKYEIPVTSFGTQIRQLLSYNSGLNITIPYKEDVLKYVNYLDPVAERIGAINTIKINRNGMIEGHNTDIWGFTESLKKYDFKAKKACLLGAGGSARAIMLGIEQLGFDSLNVYVRNLDKALDAQLPRLKYTTVNILPFTDEVSLEDCDLLINSTPVGQGRLSNSQPIVEKQMQSLPKTSVIYDLVYGQTKFVNSARDHKLDALDGSQMLILQGVKSLSLWTGQEVTDELIKVMSDAFYGV